MNRKKSLFVSVFFLVATLFGSFGSVNAAVPIFPETDTTEPVVAAMHQKRAEVSLALSRIFIMATGSEGKHSEGAPVPTVSRHPLDGMTLMVKDGKLYAAWCSAQLMLTYVDLSGPITWTEQDTVCNGNLHLPVMSVVRTDPSTSVAFVVLGGKVYAGQCFGAELRVTWPDVSMEPRRGSMFGTGYCNERQSTQGM